ncbi:alpha/beta hydrolase [Cognataquiflexum rubidum]|uniref:alpha/beta hydrolase n=1 Tax=Cognataquiflexum rubidum TaxID=2922273 RepID=UPI001F1290AB|nr:serine hydrolase family protein [Cognataquiflexum rubidum]MCH6234605.1 serine hydrolase family protein [Cognataquiflexum rubidum]
MKASVTYRHRGHYSMSHLPNRDEKEIIIALHGYGQLAEYFLKKFEPLFREDRLVVVPEATNYAYQQGFSGRVGAIWMTSHERETAIENNNHYLNEILESVLIKYKQKPVVKVIGFSQGAATASRWVSQLSFKVDTLVLWSGGFAHDLDVSRAAQNLKDTKVVVVLGDSDPMITSESIQKQNEFIASLPFEVERLEFKGGHDINLPLLKSIFA